MMRNHPDHGNLDDVGDIVRRTKVTQRAIVHKDNIYKSPIFLKMASLLDSRVSIALKLGALAVIAYTMAMQVSLHKEVISEFEKPQNFSLKHIDPAIRARIQRIQNIDDFNDWADKNIPNV